MATLQTSRMQRASQAALTRVCVCVYVCVYVCVLYVCVYVCEFRYAVLYARFTRTMSTSVHAILTFTHSLSLTHTLSLSHTHTHTARANRPPDSGPHGRQSMMGYPGEDSDEDSTSGSER
jgi:hypothetical protein